jgi:HlyD family secretion protein
MKKRTAIFLGGGLLLLSVNLFLTIQTDTLVDRSSFIRSWFEAETETITETLKTAGVVTPAEEYPIYYNPEQGGFKEFLVKKGDQVTRGTALYEYTSAQIDADRQRLESEKDKLRREVALINEQIEQLEYLQNVTSRTEGEEESSGLSAGAMIGLTIEKEIYDKEQEQSRLLTTIDDYEDQLSALDEGREIDITSEVRGIVKEVNYDLKNPVITIRSETPKVIGAFAEADMAKVEEGMEVYVYSELLGQRVGGTLTTIARHPDGEPNVEAESEFKFEIELDQEGMVPDGSGGFVWEEDEATQKAPKGKVVHGAHVDVTVVTNKVEEELAVSSEQIQKGSYLYVLTQTGKIERRDIQLGLEVDDTVEIVDGLEKGETVVANPNQVERENQPFITRLSFFRLSSEPFKTEEKMDLLKAISVGFSKQ